MELSRSLGGFDGHDQILLLHNDPLRSFTGDPDALGFTAAHAVTDLIRLYDCLRDAQDQARQLLGIAPTGPIKPARPASTLRPAADVQRGIREMGPEVILLCRGADPDFESAADSTLQALVRIGGYINGYTAQVRGKERSRNLQRLRRIARSLQLCLDHLAASGTILGAAEFNPDNAFCRPASLQGLLERLITNITTIQTASPLGPQGRPQTPDPIRFGAECMLAIWVEYHRAPPSFSRNRGGFLCWAEACLTLAVNAQGERPYWIKPTTIANALIGEVERSRQPNTGYYQSA